MRNGKIRNKNIYKLEESLTTEKYSVVCQKGNRKVKRKIKFYNLDAIISVTYRVNSKRGVLFKKWANQVIKETMIKVIVNFNQQK